MDEVIEEAIRHTNRNDNRHPISIYCKDEILMAKMDVKLIIQVIVNLIDNAMKHTPDGTEITISAEKKQGNICVSVADLGLGIVDDMKTHVFDMFFTGDNKIADSRRSLGLGLSLCKSIIEAHGGEISVSDNIPHGAKFSFTIPAEEVNMNE